MADTCVWQLEMLSSLLGVSGNIEEKEDSAKARVKLENIISSGYLDSYGFSKPEMAIC